MIRTDERNFPASGIHQLDGVLRVRYGSASGVHSLGRETTMWHRIDTSLDAGDINGDGYSDLITSRFSVGLTPLSSPDTAWVEVFLGGPTGIGPEPVQTLVVDGEEQGVTFAGDVDRDGYGDVVIQGETVLTIYRGHADGLHVNPVAVAGMANVAWEWGATNQVEWPWVRTSFAGDLNGDGYADVIAGGCERCSNPVAEMGAFVMMGGPGGLTVASVVQHGTYRSASCSDTCSNGDTFDFAFDGWCNDGGRGADTNTCAFGTDCTDCGTRYGFRDSPAVLHTAPILVTRVRGLGDLDDDGRPDIGIEAKDHHADESRGLHIYLSDTAGGRDGTGLALDAAAAIVGEAEAFAGPGDFDGDGRADLLWLERSSVNHDRWWGRLESRSAHGDGGGRSTYWRPPLFATPGDLNADGRPDIALAFDGGLYIHYGGPSGLNATRTVISDLRTPDPEVGIQSLAEHGHAMR